LRINICILFSRKSALGARGECGARDFWHIIKNRAACFEFINCFAEGRGRFRIIGFFKNERRFFQNVFRLLINTALTAFDVSGVI
jgi:hypothetical protein